jgi:nucleoside-diphosphate-sugar epimerase
MIGNALVTGASGFIGTHLCAALRGLGWHVAIAARGHRRDLSGVDAVFHLAGIAHAGVAGADSDTLRRVNVDATVELYEQARVAGVGRFVWLSSIKVLGDVSQRPLRIDDRPAPQDDYARSKTLAEEALLATAAGASDLCIVRPPLVYGPGVRANFYQLMAWSLKPWPLPLGSAQAPRAWVSVNNLVELMVRLADPATPTQPLWHVRDNEERSVADMVRLICSAAGKQARLWPLPGNVARFAGAAVGRKGWATRLFSPLQVDMGETVTRLGWTPAHDQTSEIQRVVSWYLAR